MAVAKVSSAMTTWRGPLLMLFARSACAVAAQALVAAVLAVRSAPAPWRAAAHWFPVYGTLIDAGCLALLWRLTRREGLRLFDLVGFERARLGRDVLLGLALVPPSLAFILGGVAAAHLLIYGTPAAPYAFGALPLPAALYGVLVWPFVWGLTEQMTYNGYLLPRFQALSGSAAAAVACVAFVWSFQHVVMPLTFDARFMAYRLLASIPSSVFTTVLYLRLRRLIPFVVAHALMESANGLLDLLSRG